jgi:membrane associated rhomboid family serine protease
MLEDRPYMRQSRFEPRYSATIVLIIANVAAFVIQNLIPREFVAQYLALSTDGLRHGFVWEVVTFQFLHAGFLHLLFNCLAIFFFGRPVESTLGFRKLLTLYFVSGIFGGLCQGLAGIFAPRLGMMVVGASAGAFGLTAAFSLLFPEDFIFIYAVLPIRAKYVLWFSAVYAVIAVLMPTFDPGIAHVAHLGGIICGVVLIKFPQLLEFSVPPAWLRRSSTSPTSSIRRSAKTTAWGKADRAQPGPEEYLSKEVDPILDKISAQGIQSLTDREREILERARNKMRK